jgi:glutamyl-tRNA reductase
VSIILIGLDYRTTPLALREQLHLAGDTQVSALHQLHAQGLAEVTILSTCNRLEIYAVTDNPQATTSTIMAFLTESLSPDVNLQSHLYYVTDDGVIKHLLRVAAGLESLVLGESQILGQVVLALQTAHNARTSGPILSKLFTAAIHAGKRSRTETGISRYTLSISHTAAAFIEQTRNIDLAETNILIIGAGEMGQQAAQALKMRGATTITLMNRTHARAMQIAKRLGIHELPWEALPSALVQADVVIAAASVVSPIINKDLLSTVLQSRNKRPLLLVDIGVPRNIAHEVNELDEIQLHDIDHLQTIVDRHREHRQAEAQKAHAIIQEEYLAFVHWLNTREIVPLITALHQNTEALAQAEVERTLRRLPNLTAQEQDAVYELAHRLVHKILHTPTIAMKSRAAHGNHRDYSHAISQLFALDAPHLPRHTKASDDD